MSERWIRWVIRRRGAVLVVWAAIAVVGLWSAGRLDGLLTTSLSVPGTSSSAANALLARQFDESIDGTFSVVLSSPHGYSASAQESVRARLARAASFLTGATVEQFHVVGHTLYADIDTREGLVAAAGDTGRLRARLRDEGLGGALLTGAPALEHDIGPVLASDLRRGVLVAVLVTLVLLVLVLGLSWAVLVPFVVAGATTALALLVVFLLAHYVPIALYVPNVIELIGLGLAVDYSLLVAHRFRRETLAGAGSGDAVVATMRTAGHTVLTSGLVVAAGLVTLLFVPVPFIRSLGVAGLLMPLVAVAGALTLQPALMSILGPRGFRARRFAGVLSTRAPLSGAWARLTRRVLERRGAYLAGALVVLVGLSASSWWLELTPASLTALPATMSSARALDALSSRFGPGAATPLEVVLDTGRPGGSSAPSEVAARLRLAKAILGDPEVEVVAIGVKAPYVGGHGRYEQIYVVGRDEFGAPATQALVRAIRTRFIPVARLPAGTTAVVGGAAAQGVDFLDTVYGALPWVIGATLAISYVLLLRAFRSVILPFVAALMVLVSLAAAYGVMVAVFRFGVASSLLGTYHVTQIEGWVPVFLFALLFGLSMDYEVFIVSRMREAREHGASIDESITHGLAYTGGVVSAAAVIMVGALAGLVVGRVAGLQELGVGLAAGVLIDAMLVRGVVLPSVMGLLGRWNWWVPPAVARIVRVPASPHSQGDDAGTHEGLRVT